MKANDSPRRRSFSICHQMRLIKYLRHFLIKRRRTWLKKSEEMIDKLPLDEKEKQRLYAGYCRDIDRYGPKFTEYYYSYRFPELSVKQKREFISMRDILAIVEKYRILYPEQWLINRNKERFLTEYASFVHRKWMYVNGSSEKNEVQTFLDNYDVIVKPTNSCSGNGVYKLHRGEGSADVILNGGLPAMLEECIYNEASLAEFHPASLNTIRVVTISNGKAVKIFGTVLRTGNFNSVFDNADAGGYFAEIDAETGIVISNGVTEMGEEAEAHPASGKVFKGYQVPRWDEVIDTCKRAALYKKDATLTAWDVAITDHEIDMIEGNSAPSIEIHQIPLHRGVRKKLYSIMDELDLPYRDVMFWIKIMSRVFK